MDNSAYASLILKSNKTIALAAEKGVIAFQREFENSINQIRKTAFYVFAKAAGDSVSLTLTLRKKLNKNGVKVAFALFHYGIVQEASIAARKLKRLNPDYYQILYNNKLEMFFFLIEPWLPPEIYYPSLFLNNEDATVHFLKGLLK